MPSTGAAAGLLLILLGASTTPPVAGQSPWQVQLMQNVTASSAAAAAAAQPLLLAALDDPDFRARLATCCPEVANATALELRDLLVAETQALEIVSGMPAGNGRDGGDTSLVRLRGRRCGGVGWALG